MRYFIAVAMIMMGVGANADDKADISSALDAYHNAAAEADWDTYFGLTHEDFIFLGTDAAERWDKKTFQSYAEPTNGWVYTMRERHINITPDGNSAWFDELLDSEKYGTSRGTGILIRTESGWKFSQYHLTFPMPNDLAAGFTQQIQVFEKRQKMGQN